MGVGTNVEKMDVLVADIDLVVRKGVQSVLLSGPVEVIPPILDEIGQVTVIDAGLPSLTRWSGLPPTPGFEMAPSREATGSTTLLSRSG